MVGDATNPHSSVHQRLHPLVRKQITNEESVQQSSTGWNEAESPSSKSETSEFALERVTLPVPIPRVDLLSPGLPFKETIENVFFIASSFAY